MREGSQSWQALACCKARRRPIKRHACATRLGFAVIYQKVAPPKNCDSASAFEAEHALLRVERAENQLELRRVVMRRFVRSRASVIPKEHPDCLFNDLFGGDRQALATHHLGPQRELVEDPHELVSRQRRIVTFKDAHGRQMRDIARKALGLGVHDGGELLGNPRKLAGVGHHHAEEPEVFRLPVELQNHARDQAQHLLDVALGFYAGGNASSSCPDTLRSISRKISSLLVN